MSISRRGFIRRGLLGAAAAAAGIAFPPALSAAGAVAPRAGRRALGKTGVEVSILGLGLGSAFTQAHQTDPEGALAVLERALDLGVNCWDTARSYGPSEEAIGPVVAKHRNRIFLVSKSDERSGDGFRRQLEQSLKLLRTDRIDLYHLHNLHPKRDADLAVIERGAVSAARKAKEEGLIGGFGVTGHSGAGILIDAIKRFEPDAVLSLFTATRPDQGRYEDELLPLAAERKIGVFAMKVVRHARDADLRGSELIRYALSLRGVHSAVVGLDTAAHLEENVKMAAQFKPMPAASRNAMHQHASRSLAGLIAPWDRPGYADGAMA